MGPRRRVQSAHLRGPSLSRSVVLAILAVLVAAAVNLGTELYPASWEPFKIFVLPLLLVFVAVIIVLERRGTRHLTVPPGDEMRPRSPNQLPETPVPVVGRTEMVNELAAAVRSALAVVAPGAVQPPVVVHGSAGIGKTRLAVELGRELAEEFADGVLFLDMWGVTDQHEGRRPRSPEVVVQHVLTSLGIADAELAATPEERAAQFQRVMSTSRCLIVVDNVRDERQVRHLLVPSTGSSTIVTSRWCLELEGAITREVPPLTLLDATGLLGATEQYGAEFEAARELAVCCDRNPLALTLAREARRARGDSFAATLASMRPETARLDALGVADRSVRAALAMSFDAMHTLPRTVFCALGNLGFGDASQPTVCAAVGEEADVAIRARDVLVDAGLLTKTGCGRVGFLDLVRIFAREKAEQTMTIADRDRSVERALTDFRQRAAAADRAFIPTLDLADDEWARRRRQAIEWFDAERDNLLPAIERAAGGGLDQLAASLATEYFHYLDHRRDWVSWEATHLRGVEAARRAGSPAAHSLSKLLCAMGLLEWERSAFEAARAFQEESLAIAIEIGHEERQGWAWNHMGNALAAAGSTDEAIAAQLEAIAIFERIGETRGAAWASNQLGDVALFQGRTFAAREHYEHAGDLFGCVRDEFGQAIAEANNGLAFLSEGRADVSRLFLGEARAKFERLANVFETARVDDLLGRAAAELDDHDEAIEYFRAAATSFETIGMRREEAGTLRRLAASWVTVGAYDHASAAEARATELLTK